MSTGLGGETGEVLELLKKQVRDGRLDHKALLWELGDVVHYVTRIASTYGFTMSEVINANVQKLLNRDKYGKEGGDKVSQQATMDIREVF